MTKPKPKSIFDIPISSLLSAEIEAILEASVYLIRQPGTGDLARALYLQGTDYLISSSLMDFLADLPCPSRAESLIVIKKLSEYLLEMESHD